MLRNALFLAAMFVVTVSSASAEAGIFFNRGGCPGGRCGVSRAASMAVRSTPPAPAGVAQADAVDQQFADAEQPAASEPETTLERPDADSSGNAGAPVQRASYRVGLIRRFGRLWR